ncbi:mucin-binding protein [Secundilactobacillus folii]|uniref:LPXTG cell wall anchor domain-containing protein n=1 Tax=Secundilactobacillus folii TaxID=2678357 RepID=A0A7X2XVX6_9LACO|nr:KxYKxGKxW signal peptide domain-containing protein [Secundilactobacillus folii]MTV82672.1 LPXTG cell wall anchor domain-containing protein [Secundilactobacillus folii]
MARKHIINAHNHLLRDEGQRKTHFKMYKVKKSWVYAGISMLIFGSSVMLSDVSAHAEEASANDSDSTNVVSDAGQALQKKPVTLQSGTTKAADSGNTNEASTDTTSAPSTGTSTADTDTSSANRSSALSDNIKQSNTGENDSSATTSTANKGQSAAANTTTPNIDQHTTANANSSATKDTSGLSTSKNAAASASTTKATAPKTAETTDSTSSAVFAKDGSLSDAANLLISAQSKSTQNGTSESESAVTNTQSGTADKSADTPAVNNKLVAALTQLPSGSTFKTLADGTVEFDLPSGVTSTELESAKNALANSGLKSIKVTATEAGSAEAWQTYDGAYTGVNITPLKTDLGTPITMADFALMTAAGTGVFTDPVTNKTVTNATSAQLQTYYNDLVSKYGASEMRLNNVLSDSALSDANEANGSPSTAASFADLMNYLSELYYYFVGSSDSYVNTLVKDLDNMTTADQAAMTQYGSSADTKDTNIDDVLEKQGNVFSTKYIVPVISGDEANDVGMTASAMTAYTQPAGMDSDFKDNIFEPFINNIVGTYISEIVPGAENYILQKVVPAVDTISDTQEMSSSDTQTVLNAINSNSNELTHALMTLDGSYSLTTIITHIAAMYSTMGSLGNLIGQTSDTALGVYVGAIQAQDNLQFNATTLTGNATAFPNFSMFNQLYLAYSKAIVSAAYGYAMVGKYDAIKLMYSEDPSDPEAVWKALGVDSSTAPSDIDVSKFNSAIPTDSTIQQTYQQGIWDVYHYIKPFYDQALADKADGTTIASSDPNFVSDVLAKVQSKSPIKDSDGNAITTTYSGTDTTDSNPHDEANYASPQTLAYLASFYSDAVSADTLSYSLQPVIQTIVKDASGSIIKTTNKAIGDPITTNSAGEALTGSFGDPADVSNLPATLDGHQVPTDLSSITIPESGGVIDVPYGTDEVIAGKVSVQAKNAPTDATFDYTVTNAAGDTVDGSNGVSYGTEVDLSDGETVTITVPTATNESTAISPKSSLSFDDTTNGDNTITVTYGQLVNYTIQPVNAAGEDIGTATDSISGTVDSPIDVSQLPTVTGYITPTFNDTDTDTTNDTPVVPKNGGVVKVPYASAVQPFTVSETGAPESSSAGFTYTVNGATTAQKGTYGTAISANIGDQITITPDAIQYYSSTVDTPSFTLSATNGNVAVTYTADPTVTVTPTDPKNSTDPIDPSDPTGPKYPSGVTADDLNKVLTRAITYKSADSSLTAAQLPAVINQTATYNRSATVDAKTGEVESYTDWTLAPNTDDDSNDDGFTAVTSPSILGYTASGDAPAVTLSSDDVDAFKAGDQDVTITYTKDDTVTVTTPITAGSPVDSKDPTGAKAQTAVTDSDLNRTVSRTITYTSADNSLSADQLPETVNQTAIYTRSAIFDAKTGELEGFSDWKLTDGSLDAVNSKKIPFYTADRDVEALAPTQDEITNFVAKSDDVKVTYTKDPTITVTTPTAKGVPLDPKNPTGAKANISMLSTDMERTLSRSVGYVGAVPPQPPVLQSGTYVRDAIFDAKTGELENYTDWTLLPNTDDDPTDDGFTAVQSPKLKGYTASGDAPANMLSSDEVNAFTENSVNVEIYYTKDPTVTVTTPITAGSPVDSKNPTGAKSDTTITDSDLNRTLSRTITYTGVEPEQSPVTQTGTYTRSAIFDAKTGEFENYTDWTLAPNTDGDSNDDGFTAKTSPSVTGYTASGDAPAVTLSSDDVDAFKTGDQNVTITYTKDDTVTITTPITAGSPIDPKDPTGTKAQTAVTDSDLNRTLSRTITYTGVEPEQADVTQTGAYTRSAIFDAKTGEFENYTDWTLVPNTDSDSNDDGFTAKTSPSVTGYTASGDAPAVTLSSKDVDAFKTGDRDVTITYTKDDTVTVTTPINQGSPVDSKDPNGAKANKTVTDSDLNRTVSRAITYTSADNSLSAAQLPESVNQTATYTRSAIFDAKTGELEGFSDWKLTNGSFDAVSSKKILGYTAAPDVEALTPTQDDITNFVAKSDDVTVTYTKDATITVTTPINQGSPVDPKDPTGTKVQTTVTDGDLNRTLSRTITYKGVEPEQKSVTQTETYTRSATFDTKTGELEGFSDWTLTGGSLDAVSSPKVVGYTANKDVQALTPTQDDITNFVAKSDDVTVTYTKDATVTITTPINQGSPVDPKNPDGAKANKAVTDSDLNQTVSRAITYASADNSLSADQLPKPVNQTATYTRSAIFDAKTGELEGFSDWTLTGGNLDAVSSPKVLGYTADKDVQALTPTQDDITNFVAKSDDVTVTYTKDATVTVTTPINQGSPVDPKNPTGTKAQTAVTESDLNRTVSRTITYTSADNSLSADQLPKTVNQAETYTRSAIFDAKTGELEGLSDWTLTGGSLDAVNSKKILGYTADKDVQALTPTQDDITNFVAKSDDVTVTYTKDDTVTVSSNDPKNSGDPINADDPTGPKYPSGVSESDLNKTLTRTITYTGADPEPATVQQTGKYTRNAIVDAKTGEVERYTDWTLGTNTDNDSNDDGFTAVTSPKVLGYSAAEDAPAVKLNNEAVQNFKAGNDDLTINYTKDQITPVTTPITKGSPIDPKNPNSPSSDTTITNSDLTKTVTRDISAVFDGGSQNGQTQSLVNQSNTYTRNAVFDIQTGQLLGFTDWTLAGPDALSAYRPTPETDYAVTPSSVNAVAASDINADLTNAKGDVTLTPVQVTYVYAGSTTTDPDGGTTKTGTNDKGQIVTIDKTWPDGDVTHVDITPNDADSDNPTVAVTETPSGQSALTTVTVPKGQSVTTGKTTVTNNEPNGVTLTHQPAKATGSTNPTTSPATTETVDPDGSKTFIQLPDAVSVTASDYYGPSTTDNSTGGTTNGSGNSTGNQPSGNSGNSTTQNGNGSGSNNATNQNKTSKTGRGSGSKVKTNSHSGRNAAKIENGSSNAKNASRKTKRDTTQSGFGAGTAIGAGANSTGTSSAFGNASGSQTTGETAEGSQAGNHSATLGAAANKANQSQLPQTSEATHNSSTVLGLLVGVLSMFGLAGTRRKRHDD